VSVRAAEPDVRPVERGVYQIAERRERAPKQPFPDAPERRSGKQERAPEVGDAAVDTDGERRIDITV
jgi:hypothetical protein